MARTSILLLLLLALRPAAAPAQCSDAGVCSIGAQETPADIALRAGYQFGRSGGADDLTIHAVQLEVTAALAPDTRVSAALPWGHTEGPLGDAAGIGDVTLFVHQTIGRPLGVMLGVQVGGKFATGTVNAGGLPQAYQPGLGTNDVLLGIAGGTDPWHFAAGYQLSRGRSANRVTRLRRGDDLLARAGCRLQVAELPVTVDLLAIRRLQRSSVLDSAGAGYRTVDGSDQFQINVLGMLTVPLSPATGLRAGLALPLRKRAVNLDGLTRSLGVSIDLLHTW